MTFLDWAGVVLPMLALGVGACLVMTHADEIDAWVQRCTAWWSDAVKPSKRRD